MMDLYSYIECARNLKVLAPMHNMWVARFTGRNMVDAHDRWAGLVFINGDC